MATEIVSAQQLRKVLDYCAETGVFTWRVRTSRRVNVGDVAGFNSRRGYLHIGVLGGQYLAHRLAWLHVLGHWPVGQIDHINGNKADNRISNLRDVTNRVNQQNRRLAMSSSSHGFLGVTHNHKRWMAQIVVNGKYRYLGTYDTPAEANAAYIDAKRLHHVGCTI